MRKKFLASILSITIAAISAAVAYERIYGNEKETYTLKYASLAPDGSIWGQYIRMMRQEIQKQSGGRIVFKPYLGGVVGNEKSIARKLRAGSLHIASFSGQGLGEILSDIRIMELPMMFNSYDEVDNVTQKIRPDMEKAFSKKGYIFAAWGEGGFVYLLSKEPIKSAKDMKGMRVWAPTGDDIVKSLFIKYGLVPTYVGIESVLPQLQTGGLEAVYGPPMAVIGLQWFREVRYLTQVKLAYSTAATLINKKAFSKLPADLQKIILDVIEKYSRKLTIDLRKQNERALGTLKKNGIKILQMDGAEIKTLRELAMQVQNDLSGSLYSKELLEKVKNSR